MTIKYLFAVRDTKVGVFQKPFLMRNAAEAIRGFESVVNDHNTEFYRYPDDFTLYQMAEFDEETGVITQSTDPQILVNAVELRTEDLEAHIKSKS